MTKLWRLLAVLSVFALVTAACAQDEGDGDGGNGSAEPLPGAGMKAARSPTAVASTTSRSTRRVRRCRVRPLRSSVSRPSSWSPRPRTTTPRTSRPSSTRAATSSSRPGSCSGRHQGGREANPDSTPSSTSPSSTSQPVIPNVLGLTFQTDQAAFLAGYVAAAMPRVARSPPTAAYRSRPSPSSWTGSWRALAPTTRTTGPLSRSSAGTGTDGGRGFRPGNFENQDDGRRLTEDFIAEGADIILPVAGPAGAGTTAAAQDNPGTKVIWVDTDGCISAPEFCDLFLTSVLKNIDVAVYDAIAAVVDGSFEVGSTAARSRTMEWASPPSTSSRPTCRQTCSRGWTS